MTVRHDEPLYQRNGARLWPARLVRAFLALVLVAGVFELVMGVVSL